jgi:8-oxo-dGTP pyrophosphatase MutT (NUDIX family)
MSWLPHVTVAAVIENNGRFLVVEERVDHGPTVFNQPAGHLEEGESLLEAVMRETREETARSFTPKGVVGIYRWRVPDSGVTYLRVCLFGECSEPDFTLKLDQGIEKTHWLTKKQLQEQAHRLRSPMVLECIDDYLTGNRFPLGILRDLR